MRFVLKCCVVEHKLTNCVDIPQYGVCGNESKTEIKKKMNKEQPPASESLLSTNNNNTYNRSSSSEFNDHEASLHRQEEQNMPLTSAASRVFDYYRSIDKCRKDAIEILTEVSICSIKLHDFFKWNSIRFGLF